MSPSTAKISVVTQVAHSTDDLDGSCSGHRLWRALFRFDFEEASMTDRKDIFRFSDSATTRVTTDISLWLDRDTRRGQQ